MQLSGARALVTGATGGIGTAIARALHRRGATVLLSGRREAVLEELRLTLGERAELDVAPLSLRLGTRISELAPITAGRVQRRLGSERIADALAKAQRGKR